MNNQKDSENRETNIGRGNYYERIENKIYYGNSEKEQVFPEICKNRQHLSEYLDFISKKLRRNFGFVDVRSNVIEDNQNFNLLAVKPNFDMSVGFVQMRGEAFFLISELEEIDFAALKTYSTQCLNYSKSKANSNTAGNAIYNFKIPNNLCFAVAIVDEIDQKARTDVRQINPLRDTVDALWYEIPVVYELNNKQLYFYEKPLDWQDKFTGEIVWKEIRKIIRQTLLPTM